MKPTFQTYLGVLNTLTELKQHLAPDFIIPYLIKVVDQCVNYVNQGLNPEDLRTVTK